jgi:hypothetical protein
LTGRRRQPRRAAELEESRLELVGIPSTVSTSRGSSVVLLWASMPEERLLGDERLQQHVS